VRSFDEASALLIRTVAETGSTNDDLLALAREGAAEDLWLRAERQTGGKGRLGRAWHSPSGNLHASTLVRLRPGDPPPASLAFVAAVALQEVVQAHAGAHPVRIKWPNDLVVGAAKLAGILLERIEDAVVLGFGVNLAAYPEDLAGRVISVRELTGTAPDAESFLEELARSFGDWLARWRGEGLVPILGQWRAMAHPPGTPLSVSTGRNDRLEGSFDGLAEDGALRLRLADGTIHVIRAGDVFLSEGP
jgi:BirA family biotin operon repressor/biotin-[acetyl-CoA-carboxylase] ligase